MPFHRRRAHPGAGKSSLVNALLAREDVDPAVDFLHLARAARQANSEGSHYHFVSRRGEFEAMIATWRVFRARGGAR
jgi:guanylate kinase